MDVIMPNKRITPRLYAKYCVCSWFIFFSSMTVVADELIAHVHPNWAPTYSLVEDNWQGSAIDFYRAIAAEAGMTLRFTDIPWAQCKREMQLGTCHIQAQLTPTEERKIIMDFIGPYGMENVVIAVARTTLSVKLDSLQDIFELARKTGLKIAIAENRVFDDDMSAFLSREDIHPYLYYHSGLGTEAEIYKQITAEKILGSIEESMRLVHNIKKTRMQDDVFVHPFVIAETPQYFGVGKALSAEMFAALKAAHERLVEKGEYRRIAAEWGSD
jgi:ABC-type amino acid transport substrate-binding protein